MADIAALIVRRGDVLSSATLATSTTVLDSNSTRGGFFIQNQGTNPVYVCFGAGASATHYHIALAAGTAAKDGNGGILSQMQGVVYTGLISASGTGLSYSIAEF